MGQHELVLFFKTDLKYLPFNNDEDIWALEMWNELEKGKNCYVVSSRNGSYHYGLLDICEELELSGLEFIEEEINVLTRNSLVKAREDLSQVISTLSKEIPVLTKTREGRDTIWWLRHTPRGEPYPPDTPQRAFSEAIVSQDLHDWDRDDCMYGDAICFFSFLKSLQHAFDEAIAAEQILVFYKPLL